MTKEEVKEIFDHNWTKLVNPDYSDDDLAEAQNWVIETLSAELQGFEDYLKQYLGENDQMIISKDVWEETKTKAEQTEWISVKDRLPDNTNNVLISCSNFDQCTGELYQLVIVGFYKESCGWLMDGYSCPYSVDAWMPKPSPYRRE